jgi:hypothetical protein
MSVCLTFCFLYVYVHTHAHAHTHIYTQFKNTYTYMCLLFIRASLTYNMIIRAIDQKRVKCAF